MKFYVGVTDNSWFQYLAKHEPDEVNFWKPSGKTGFSAINPGDLFLFKLKSPYNHIAGGGFFVRHLTLPLTLAWEAFREKNGAPNYRTLHQTISSNRNDNLKNPTIGCSILSQPFFFPQDQWIPAPENWKRNIVSGKSYTTSDYIGKNLFDAVIQRIQPEGYSPGSALIGERSPQYSHLMTKVRLGQGAFRVLVTESYHRRCAITGERTLPVLEAAHIKPFSENGPNQVNNGLLLRSDLHILFDKGYLTVTEDFSIEVSKRIKEEFENGRDYYAFHGNRLKKIPSIQTEKPDSKFIQWHNDHVYLP